jgi:hypothetical protein
MHSSVPTRCLQPGEPCRGTAYGSTRGTNHARATTSRRRSRGSLCHRAPRTLPRPGPGRWTGGSASPPKWCRQCDASPRSLLRDSSPFVLELCSCPLNPNPPAPSDSRAPPRRSTESTRTEVRMPTCVETLAASGVDRTPSTFSARSALASLLHRCLSMGHTVRRVPIACGPAANALRHSPTRRTPERMNPSADRLQGFAPPTSP